MLSTNDLRPELRKQYLDTNQSQVLKDLIGLIRASKMTYKDIAEKTGVNPRTVACWVDGTTTHPRIITFSAVAALFGYKLELVLDQDRRH